MALAYNPITWVMESQDHKLTANLGYIVSSEPG